MNFQSDLLSDPTASPLRQSESNSGLAASMASESVSRIRSARIGAVSYLNSKPLVEGLSELLPDAELRLDFPSRLADELARDQLDVALIPSIEYFRGQQYQIISDACVSAHGPVLSVKLYSRVPWGEIRTLALDEGSRTSATLARIMLAERHGVFPELQPLPLDHRTDDTTADAILLIGDRAILPPKEQFPGTWDLGEEWCQWTGLPFVFAMWVANRRRIHDIAQAEPRPGIANRLPEAKRSRGMVDMDQIERALNQSRDRGVARLEEIARREAPLLGLSFPTTISYLSVNLQYHLGRAERSGLKLFYELASGLDLAPKGVDLIFQS
ncbi:menaquinone biosynthetic enzyme MqnA/MqnD family protein [Schlesneria paludicola]|uniref:menaquinone biosynthetic enzyme MqnA/MqnD family protein n=1 Tax=Schlesneria paludicola TaxID=360056 RepID=UPI00029B150A|nr:menaquinone biosynthesis protein [Schlesneria paludicola]